MKPKCPFCKHPLKYSHRNNFIHFVCKSSECLSIGYGRTKYSYYSRMDKRIYLKSIIVPFKNKEYVIQQDYDTNQTLIREFIKTRTSGGWGRMGHLGFANQYSYETRFTIKHILKINEDNIVNSCNELMDRIFALNIYS